MDNLAYKERGEDENDEPPSLLQIIDEGFSFEHLKVVEYTTNEEDYQEVLSQGYGENNLIASGHYVKLESWDVSVLLTVEYKHFLVRGLIYQDHSQVEWLNENDAVNKIFLFEELVLEMQVSGAMHEYVIDMLAKELLKIILNRYGTSTLDKDFLVIGKENDSQIFTNYLNSSILENKENIKLQYVSNKTNPMLMYIVDKSNSINEKEEEEKEADDGKYSVELASEEDIITIKEEWRSNGVALSQDFNIDLEEKLSKIIYICKKDTTIQCFAILEEILFKEAGVVELLLTYSFEQCEEADKALKYLLNKIIFNYFTIRKEEYNFTSICTFALPDVPLENYQVLIDMGFTIYKDYFEFKLTKSILYLASSQSDRLENITKDRIKSKRHRRPPTKGFVSKNKETKTHTPTPIAPDPTIAADIEEIEKEKSKVEVEEEPAVITETIPNKPFRPPTMMPGMPGMGKIDLSAVVLRKTGKDVREGRRTIKLESEGNEQEPTIINPSHMAARRSSLIVSHQVPTKPKRPPPNTSTINKTNNTPTTATVASNIPSISTSTNSDNEKGENKILKITVPLTAPVNKKDKIFTAYVITLQETSGSRNVIKRYKEIHAFNQSLSKTFKKLPKFPSKKIIGNLKEEYVSKRKAKIESYLNELIKREDVTSSLLFKSFMK